MGPTDGLLWHLINGPGRHMKTRILVVDDHISTRQMITALLPNEGPYEIVGEAGTGLEALQLCEELKPQLVVLDLVLPEMSGVSVLRHLREKAKQTRTLVYSRTRERELILEALQAMPHGFVLKHDPWRDFCDALRRVSGGCRYFTSFAAGLLDEAHPGKEPRVLTERENTVLQMIAESRGNKEIAERLKVSTKTVEHHRANLMQKLSMRDVAALTRHAIKLGLVGLE